MTTTIRLDAFTTIENLKEELYQHKVDWVKRNGWGNYPVEEKIVSVSFRDGSKPVKLQVCCYNMTCFFCGGTGFDVIA